LCHICFWTKTWAYLKGPGLTKHWFCWYPNTTLLHYV
jgi:hypothetical protein